MGCLKRTLAVGLTLGLGLGLPGTVSAKNGKSDTPPTTPIYIEPSNPPSPSLGSLWTTQSGVSDLASDYKAHNINDLIVIRIVENTSADATGNLTGSRAFSASSNLTGLLGKLKSSNNLQNLLGATSSHSITGKADSSSSTTLNTLVAGRVVQVLPNGTLVVEATREIELNGQKCTATVRGLVRSGDIAADNSILSTQISDLQVALKGKGAVSDFTHQPNVVVRTLLRLLSF